MFKEFKPIFGIFLRFLLIYLSLVGLYQLYLNQFHKDLDIFSHWIGHQSTKLQNWLGYISYYVEIPGKKFAWFYVSGDYRSIMVEGCNALSVMMLFVAFVFAFYKGWKTFLFTGISLVFLHIINVLRIAGMNIVLADYPKYGKIGHDYFFPAIIYGSVIVLWLIWIKYILPPSDETT